MSLNERLKALHAAHTDLKQMTEALEKTAADLLEDAHAAGDMSVYTDAVHHQRAAHFASDLLAIEPDAPNTGLVRHQSSANAFRSELMRWLTLATDDQIERFQQRMIEAGEEGDEDGPPMNIISSV